MAALVVLLVRLASASAVAAPNYNFDDVLHDARATAVDMVLSLSRRPRASH
jgi:hypothetical protein